MTDSMNIIVSGLPADYRWATCCEAENWPTLIDAIQVRVGGTNDEPWTDIAVPIQTPKGCDCGDEQPLPDDLFVPETLQEFERYASTSRSW